MVSDTSRRKKTEAALSREASVNAAIAELSSALISPVPIDEISSIVLDHAKNLTDSMFGFVGYIDPETDYLVVPTLTRDILDDCQVAEKDIVFKKFTGLWGWVLNNRKTLLTNTPSDDPRASGTPPGHIPIQRFLSTPAVINSTLVGQVGVANASRDYTEQDASLVERLAALYAIAIQRKWAEEELRKHRDHLEEMVKKRTVRLNMLSEANQMLVRSREESELLNSICRIIVEIGGYRLAWVGYALDDKGKTVRPVAQAGYEDGYLETLNITWASTGRGRGPTGKAIRTGKPCIAKNIVTDPDFAPWRSEALKRGFASSVALPLITDSKTIGALNIYAAAPDAFDEEEVNLLMELASDLAYGLTSLHTKEELKKSEEKYRTLVTEINEGIVNTDDRGIITFANKALGDIYGFDSPEELLGKTVLEFIAPEMKDKAVKEFTNSIKTGKFPELVDVPVIRKDGSTAFVQMKLGPIIKKDRVTGVRGVIRDITERKKAEEKLNKAYRRTEEEARISSTLLNFTTSIAGLLDVKAILEEVSKTILKLTSSERTTVVLKDSKKETYSVVAFHGWPEYLTPVISTLKLSKGDIPAFDRILQGEDVHISNAKTSDLIKETFTETLDLRALIISPLVTSEYVMGAVMAERHKPFFKSEAHILKGIASSASIAIENTMFYKESIEMAADLTRKIEAIETTFEIDRIILSMLNRQEILEVITNNIQRIFPADKVVIIHLDEKTHSYLYEKDHISFGQCMFLDSIFKTGRIVSVPDISTYRHRGPVIMDLIKAGLTSFLAFPLHSKDKRFGYIIMASKRVGAFDRDDISHGERLTTQMSIALENASLYEDIKELFLSTLRALSHAIDAKSPWTRGHSDRVTSYAISLGREMGLPDSEIEKLELAGLLHDIGKIGTYDIVLDKPEKLTDEEFGLVKRHPEKGVEILENIRQLKDILPIIRHHHEKVDGTGYPEGLKGDRIPLLARILCVADSYDSMTADRPYRLAPGKEYAITELERCSGTQFDPDMVEAFLRVLTK